MARLRDRNDDLSDMTGLLGRDFNRATVRKLRDVQKAFLNAAGTEKEAAIEVLTKFHRAARSLRISETAFNQRARRDNNSQPSLLDNLRDSTQLRLARDFETAKRALVEFNPELGKRIATLVAAQDFKSPVKPRLPFPRP